MDYPAIYEHAYNELLFVTEQLSDQVIEFVISQAKSGNLQGRWYIDESGCGCFYGTISLFKSFFENNQYESVDSLKRSLFENASPSIRNVCLTGLSPIERRIQYVHKGDTPETHTDLAWLVDSLTEILNQRQSND